MVVLIDECDNCFMRILSLIPIHDHQALSAFPYHFIYLLENKGRIVLTDLLSFDKFKSLHRTFDQGAGCRRVATSFPGEICFNVIIERYRRSCHFQVTMQYYPVGQAIGEIPVLIFQVTDNMYADLPT